MHAFVRAVGWLLLRSNSEPYLQMIGSGKDPAAVQRHLRKMFAGIQSLDVHTDGGKLTAMRSKEGEVVDLADAVAFSRETEVNVWLSKAEEAMRTALAWWMVESVTAGGWLVSAGERLEGDLGSRSSLLAWIDASPTQVVLLALQVHVYHCAAWRKLARTPCLPTMMTANYAMRLAPRDPSALMM